MLATGADDHPGLDEGLLQVAEVGVPQGLVELGPVPEGVISPAGFLPVPGRNGQAAAVRLLLPPLVEPGDQGRPALRQHHVGQSEGRPPGSGQLANEPCVDELADRVVGPASGHAYPRQDLEEGVAGDRLEGCLAVRPGADELHENLPGGALLVGGEALVEGVGGPLDREPPPADSAVGVPGDQVAPALAPELPQGELQQGKGERVAHQVVDQGIDHALLEPQAGRGRRPGDRLAEFAGIGWRNRHPGGLDQVAERPGLFEPSGLGVADQEDDGVAGLRRGCRNQRGEARGERPTIVHAGRLEHLIEPVDHEDKRSVAGFGGEPDDPARVAAEQGGLAGIPAWLVSPRRPKQPGQPGQWVGVGGDRRGIPPPLAPRHHLARLELGDQPGHHQRRLAAEPRADYHEQSLLPEPLSPIVDQPVAPVEGAGARLVDCAQADIGALVVAQVVRGAGVILGQFCVDVAPPSPVQVAAPDVEDRLRGLAVVG